MINSNYNAIRLTGMYSGLDTDALVKAMLTASQTKLNKQAAIKTKLQWKVDGYRDINNILRAFKDDFGTVTKQAQNMLSINNYKAYKVNMKTQTGAVSISAGPNATAGSVTIQKISDLAKGARAVSAGRVTGSVSDSLSTDMTLEAASAKMAVPISFDVDDNVSIEINGETFTFSKNTKISEVISQINNSDANVTLSYTQLTDSFTLSSKTMGLGSTLAYSDTNGGNLFAAFGFDGSVAAGQDARLTILDNDGNEVEITRSSNNFILDGISYSLLKTSDTAIDFTVERDVDASMAVIKNYIDEYNKIVDKLNTKITEVIYKAYGPLTDEQREALTSDQIDKWETSAKSGLFKNDSAIKGLMQQLRGLFYTPIGGTGKLMSQIGLTTTANYMDGGKITIDDTKLREALTKNPDEVFAMFGVQNTKVDAEGNTVVDYENCGLVRRINETINKFVKDSESRLIYNANQSISNTTTLIDNLTRNLENERARYYAKFTALEKAMAKLSEQSSKLSSLMGG